MDGLGSGDRWYPDGELGGSGYLYPHLCEREQEGLPWPIVPSTFHWPSRGLVKVGSTPPRMTEMEVGGGDDLI